MSDRIGAVRTYIEEEETCRSRMLLAYFGETESTPCGACDVCLRKHPSGLHQYIIDAVGEELERSFFGTTAESYPVEKSSQPSPTILWTPWLLYAIGQESSAKGWRSMALIYDAKCLRG